MVKLFPHTWYGVPLRKLYTLFEYPVVLCAGKTRVIYYCTLAMLFSLQPNKNVFMCKGTNNCVMSNQQG